MIRERDKSRKILNALIDYFVVHDFSEFVSSIAIEDGKTKIVVEGIIDPSNLNEAEIREHLNHPRMQEYEDMYDNLLESNVENELDAVGYLVDEADISLDVKALSIKLVRYHY